MNSDDKERWTKSCPKCGEIQIYSSWDSLRFAIGKNTICNTCRASIMRIVPPNGVWKRVCRLCGDDMIYSCRNAFNMGKRTNAICRTCAVTESSKYSDKSHFSAYEYKTKMSNALKAVRNTDSYGEEFKRKCRENKLKQIQQQGVQRTYNPDACHFMDRMSQQFGWNLRHAMNGGEVQVVGYSLDGYDLGKNIVFEYDEPKHRISFHANKDKERERRIIEVLHPIAFFRYDEKDKKLMEVIGNKEVICQHQ